MYHSQKKNRTNRAINRAVDTIFNIVIVIVIVCLIFMDLFCFHLFTYEPLILHPLNCAAQFRSPAYANTVHYLCNVHIERPVEYYKLIIMVINEHILLKEMFYPEKCTTLGRM